MINSKIEELLNKKLGELRFEARVLQNFVDSLDLTESQKRELYRNFRIVYESRERATNAAKDISA